MVAATLAPDRPRLDIANQDLVLRISGSPRDGQIVRLKSAKCTIGSGRRCTLRIQANGVAPIHCLILRGQTETVVRRWSADTRLNDQSFTDAPLYPGDRLSIGPIELDVLGIGVHATPVAEEPENDPCFDSASGAQFEQLSARLAEFESERESFQQQRGLWQAEQEAAQRRFDEQNKQLAARQAELETVRNALADDRRQWQAQREQDVAQATGQSEQFNIRLAEFESKRQSLEQQRVQWQAEREAAEQRLAEQRGQLAAQQTELETERNTLTDEHRQWHAQQEQNAAQAKGQSEQFATRLAELESERQSFEQQRVQWQAERDAAERRFDEQRRQLAAQQTELETQRNALAEERRQWERQQAESPTMAERLAESSEPSVEAEALPVPAAQEPQFEEPAAQAPVDLADVFRRVGAKIALPDEEPNESQSPAPIVGPRDTAPEPTAKPPVALAPEEIAEESIDDYMGRLMQRLRSTTGESGSGPRPSQRLEPSRCAQEEPSAAPSAESTMPQSTVASPMPGDEPCEPATSLPRARALQKPINMSALRELANLSAHHALKRYSRRVLINSMHAKLILSGVAFAAGGALLWMWNLRHQHNLTFYSAIVAFLVGIYGVVQYALMTGRLMVNESGQLKWNAFRPGKVTPPPAANSNEKSPDEDDNPVAPGDTPSATIA